MSVLYFIFYRTDILYIKLSFITSFLEEIQTVVDLNCNKVRLIPILLVGIGGSLFAATRFGREVYKHKNFTAPAFATWFIMSWSGILLPIVIGVAMLSGYNLSKCKSIISEPYRIYNQFSVGLYIIKVLPLCFLLDGTVFLASSAMVALSSFDVTIILLSTTPLTYLFTYTCNNQNFNIIKITGTILSIAGLTVMIIQGILFHPPGTDIRMALASSVFLALYQISIDSIFKRRMHPLQLAFIQTSIGIYSLLTFWIPMIVFYYLGLDRFELHQIPWQSLLLASISIFIHFSLVHLSHGIINPRILLLGRLLAVMLNGIVDTINQEIEFDSLRTSATVLLVTSLWHM
ncbi:uncharacterized protein TRIADDRAFT_52252 [Trichoplax adhaerens]|uniref:Sugar phosphate transporter domain-containing protein n=1 Tax=Trichoplax adhaerens TaxID=10228 RepID=B3RM66_TRIAD|nr:hypothetical protein TRIADDRAFT_52252 [Trichoplax adhaerens]EDV28910.1 hypothetical protein TRIADDRAFT_52252 [Trichoplax adhaerens]|eukprot:XP_002108112.1 hypothetical protein TRIADDRAFT_52252 [Trichoplax adhaerens]